MNEGGTPVSLVSLVSQGTDILIVVLGELQANCSGKMAQEQHGEQAGLLLNGVDELQHLREKLRGAVVLQGLRGEERLGLLVGGELVSHQESSLEVVVAVVAGGGKDVCHPAG